MSSNVNNSNIKQLRNGLRDLSNKYERQCSKIHEKFDDIRNDLSRKENDIINDLTNYTNECKSIIQQSINKMEQMSNSTVNTGSKSSPNLSNVNNNNGYKRQSNVNKYEQKEEKQPVITSNNVSKNISRNASTGIDYSDATTGANNPWKSKQQASYATTNRNVSTNTFVSSFSSDNTNSNTVNNSNINTNNYTQLQLLKHLYQNHNKMLIVMNGQILKVVGINLYIMCNYICN